MKAEEKYDPEDLEYLLSNKTFDELYPEEQSFVLKHIESKDEYVQMRKTLMHLNEAKKVDDEWSTPNAMRDQLIKAHEHKHKKRTFFVWLNSLFAAGSFNTPIYRRPGVQLAFASVVIVVFGIFIIGPELEQQSTISMEIPQSSTKAKETESEKLTEEQVVEKTTDAETISNSTGGLTSFEQNSLADEDDKNTSVEENESEKFFASSKDKKVEDIANQSVVYKSKEIVDQMEPETTGDATITSFDFAQEDNSRLSDNDNAVSSTQATSIDNSLDELSDDIHFDGSTPAYGNSDIRDNDEVLLEADGLTLNEPNTADDKIFTVEVSTSASSEVIDLLYTCW